MDAFNEDIDLRGVSPEHIVSEHRVGVSLACPLDADGNPDRTRAEHAVVLGLYDGVGDDAVLIGLRILTVKQAGELGAFLLETTAQARAQNAKAAKGKEGE